MQAFELYGITRLSGRIYDLRKSGVKIKDCFCEDVNHYGKTVRFKKYFLGKERKRYNKKRDPERADCLKDSRPSVLSDLFTA